MMSVNKILCHLRRGKDFSVFNAAGKTETEKIAPNFDFLDFVFGKEILYAAFFPDKSSDYMRAKKSGIERKTNFSM